MYLKSKAGRWSRYNKNCIWDMSKGGFDDEVLLCINLPSTNI